MNEMEIEPFAETFAARCASCRARLSAFVVFAFKGLVFGGGCRFCTSVDGPPFFSARAVEMRNQQSQ